jgi:hypothetical protein
VEIVVLFAKFHRRKVEGDGTGRTHFEATGIGKNGDIITVRQECVAVLLTLTAFRSNVYTGSCTAIGCKVNCSLHIFG